MDKWTVDNGCLRYKNIAYNRDTLFYSEDLGEVMDVEEVTKVLNSGKCIYACLDDEGLQWFLAPDGEVNLHRLNEMFRCEQIIKSIRTGK